MAGHGYNDNHEASRRAAHGIRTPAWTQSDALARARERNLTAAREAAEERRRAARAGKWGV